MYSGHSTSVGGLRDAAAGGSTGNKVPVFVFPSSVTFYTDDQSSYKQVLTVYNPYDFVLKFKVLSTSPKKYLVTDSEGVVKPRCCVDIVIRHTDVCSKNEGIRDKFRIQISERGQKSVIGKKDVISILLPTIDQSHAGDDKFEQLPRATTSSASESQQRMLNPSQGRSSGPSLFVIFAAISCIFALMLPNQGDRESRLPTYIHLSQNQKLIAAYVLGLVTMVLLRT
ncbi:motile sperm domain-containing protein 1-like [Tubulanus polymorphus]|uniref:motile sperm domain-containing protein 1-like n=1 Tax=Tubulanus polymorphus TaxID=672921 RepID=UPI003DA5BD00